MSDCMSSKQGSVVRPESNDRAIDCCWHFIEKRRMRPPQMLVQGDNDKLPGSTLAYLEKALFESKAAGASTVELQCLQEDSHRPDMYQKLLLGRPMGDPRQSIRSSTSWRRVSRSSLTRPMAITGTAFLGGPPRLCRMMFIGVCL